MAEHKWKKVETSPTWDFREDKEFEGIFVGVETEVGPNKSNLYSFKTENGIVISVWGNTILDTRFKNLEVGDWVRIVYKGKTESPKTGRTYHDFDVFKDEDQGGPVGEPEVEVGDEPPAEEQ